MKNKTYTIIISPSDLAPAIKVTLHKSTIILSVVTLAVLIVCGAGGSYFFLEGTNRDWELRQATEEIVELREANQILMRSKEKELKLREFLGLEGSVDNLGEAGQGGPGADREAVEDIHSRVPQSLIDESGSWKKKKGSSLLAQARALEDNFQELLDYLEEDRNGLATTPTISPVAARKAWISSSYGYRRSPFSGVREFHSGLDISCRRGTPILATGDGTVTFAGRKGGLGTTVKIRHNDEYVTIYGHLLKANVTLKQKVKRGDIIGHMGNSGRSTGYHVHYEVKHNGRSVNPYHYVLNWKDRHLLSEQAALNIERTK